MRSRRTRFGPFVAALLLTGCDARPAAPEADRTTPLPSPASSSAPLDPSRTATGDPTLLLANFNDNTATFVDPTKKGDAADLGSVEVGTAPYGIALGKDGTAWVSTAQGVAVVDTRTRERTDLIRYRTEVGPPDFGEYRGGGMGIAISPDGTRVYVGLNVPGEDGRLEVIDTATRRVIRTVPVGSRPFDVDVSADGTTVFVTNHDSYDVTIVDTKTWDTQSVLVDPYDTGRNLGAWLKPHYAAVRPSDGALLVPFEGERLLVVDPDTGEVGEEKLTADTHQHGATIAPDGTLFVVGTGGTPDSGNGPSLTIRSPRGVERVIPLDGPHEDVVLSTDARTAYVSGGFTRDGYWDGISIVDVATGKVIRLGVGERPLGMAVLTR